MNEAKKKQLRYDIAYMKMAEEWAKLSHCTRKNVGALIVKDKMIIADGYNGSPSGFPNECENDEGAVRDPKLEGDEEGATKLLDD